MPFSIHPYRRFPVQRSATPHFDNLLRIVKAHGKTFLDELSRFT